MYSGFPSVEAEYSTFISGWHGDNERILNLGADDPFRHFLQFVWFTGARPREARHIEPRHVDLENERIIFPVEESKGKRTKRVIYLQGVALEIITRLYKPSQTYLKFSVQRN